MLEQTNSARAISHARVVAVIPIEDRGHHELLRLAAALGEYLQPDFAQALADAAQKEDIVPAHIEFVTAHDAAQGVLAHVENRQIALGQYGYLLQLGLVPKAAEIHIARRIAASGNTAFYLMIVEDNRCLGLIGIEARE